MPDDHRPNPDALLAAIQKTEAAQKRGKLKVFLGMAAGVGKTYAMLRAAQRAQREGRDVVIGYVETHGRKETDDLVAGLPVILRRKANTAASCWRKWTWTPSWPAVPNWPWWTNWPTPTSPAPATPSATRMSSNSSTPALTFSPPSTSSTPKAAWTPSGKSPAPLSMKPSRTASSTAPKSS